MAGFDIGSLLNSIMGGNKQQAQAQDGNPGRPQQSGGGLGGMMNSDMLAKLAPMLSGLLAGGGLAKLMGQLKGGGLGDQAKSWVATDQANQAVSGEQLTRALGEDEIAHFANTLGMSNEQAAQTMAQTLPRVVDAMTPDGRMPQAAAANQGPDSADAASGPQTG